VSASSRHALAPPRRLGEYSRNARFCSDARFSSCETLALAAARRSSTCSPGARVCPVAPTHGSCRASCSSYRAEAWALASGSRYRGCQWFGCCSPAARPGAPGSSSRPPVSLPAGGLIQLCPPFASGPPRLPGRSYRHRSRTPTRCDCLLQGCSTSSSPPRRSA
jgi:hypothetical protein